MLNNVTRILLKCVILSVYLQKNPSLCLLSMSISYKAQAHVVKNTKLLSCTHKLPFFVFSLPAAASEGIIE